MKPNKDIDVPGCITLYPVKWQHGTAQRIGSTGAKEHEVVDYKQKLQANQLNSQLPKRSNMPGLRKNLQ